MQFYFHLINIRFYFLVMSKVTTLSQYSSSAFKPTSERFLSNSVDCEVISRIFFSFLRAFTFPSIPVKAYAKL